MEEELIKFETAKLAKEKGFKEMVAHHYTDELVMPKKEVLGASTNGEKDKFSAPRQSLLQKWLREEHNVNNLNVLPHYSNDVIQGYKPWRGLLFTESIYKFNKEESFKTYEEALENGLIEALKLIPNIGK